MELLDNISEKIKNTLLSTQISGLAVSLIQNGEVVYNAGFGHDGQDELSPQSPFEVASLSKPVFAYAVLQLCEQGKLNLDTPISDYLPSDYILGEPRLSAITIRHALSHTSGFPNWRNESGLSTLFPPGSAFHYSTEGLIYLQTALEYVIQQPFHHYVHENIFEPFGMTSSEFLPVDMSPFPDYLPRHLYSFGATSLRTTALDYARFLVEMMSESRSDTFHLSPLTLSEMLTPAIQVGDQKGLFWGLGWGLCIVEGRASFWHWGQRFNQNRCFAMASLEEQSGVVILTNHENGLIFCSQLLDMLMGYKAYPAFQWLLPPDKWRADGYNLA